jgi:hypothetical protein
MATGLLDYLDSRAVIGRAYPGKKKKKNPLQVAGGSFWDHLDDIKPNTRGFYQIPDKTYGPPSVPMPSPKMKFPFRDVLGRIWTEEEWIKNQQRQAEQRRRQAERMNLPKGLQLL